MKLLELLKDMQGVNIKLGFKSGFVYCGMCPADPETMLDKLYRKDMHYFTQRLDTVESRLTRFSAEMNEQLIQVAGVCDDMLGSIEEVEKESQLTITTYLNKRINSYNSLVNQQNTYNEELHRPRYTEREVLDVYESIDPDEPDGTMIIIADGIKTGTYYTSQEYKRR